MRHPDLLLSNTKRHSVSRATMAGIYTGIGSIIGWVPFIAALLVARLAFDADPNWSGWLYVPIALLCCTFAGGALIVIGLASRRVRRK